jgi:hypothetical protein
MIGQTAVRATAFITALLWIRATTAAATPNHTPPAPDALWTSELSREFQHFDEGTAWPVAERKAYGELLGSEHCDWLLAPTQVQLQGFGREERSAITAMLAQTLADAGVVVPNTFLVERALGDGRRSLRPDSIGALAQRVGAANMILPFVGHDGGGHLTLTLGVYRKTSASAASFPQQPQWFTWSGIQFSDEIAPVVAVAGLRTEILKSMGFPATGGTNEPPVSKPFVLPSSPEELQAPERTTGALNKAAGLAVLAVVAPPVTRGAERLYERSLLAALRAPDSPEQRFLNAYALFRLGLRPNALHVLRTGSPSAALAALTALVNGNLPGTGALVQQTSGYQRFILEFELHDLSRVYGHDEAKALPAVLHGLAARSDWWANLVNARWDYYRPWANMDSVPLKNLLDRHYPIPGQSLKDIITAHRVTPGQSVTEADIQVSVLQHVRSVLISDRSSLCCVHALEQVNALDLLSIVESWSTVPIMRSIDLVLSTRGLPEQALE